MTCTRCGQPRRTRPLNVLGLIRDMPMQCETVGCDVSEDRRRASTLQSLAATVLERSSVPAYFRDAPFSAETPRAVKNAIAAELRRLPDFRTQWEDDRLRDVVGHVLVQGSGFGFFGGNGTGKTSAMGVFLRGARERLIPGILLPATYLQMELEDAHKYTSRRSVFTIVDRYVRTPLLVLDDIDKIEGWTTAVTVPLYEIIDARMRNNRPIYITTNVSPDQIAAKVFGRREDHANGANRRWVDMVAWMPFAARVERRGEMIA